MCMVLLIGFATYYNRLVFTVGWLLQQVEWKICGFWYLRLLGIRDIEWHRIGVFFLLCFSYSGGVQWFCSIQYIWWKCHTWFSHMHWVIETPTLSSSEGWRNSFKRAVNRCFATTFFFQRLHGPTVRNSNSKSSDSICFTAFNNFSPLISLTIFDSIFSTTFNNSSSLNSSTNFLFAMMMFSHTHVWNKLCV